MKRPWHAEYDVSLPAVEARIRAQLPELGDLPVVPLDTGWDNSMFEVGEWVLRFPRRALALELIERELAVLPWLAPQLPLPVPVPELIGRPDEGYPARFFGYRKLPGATFDRAAPGEAARCSLARELGEFVGSLHALEPERATEAGALPNPRRCDLERRYEVAGAALDGLGRTAVAGRVPELRMLVEQVVGRAREFSEVELRLVHGDLHVRNLLVDDDGEHISGVIDWGDNGIADPALDLGLAQLAFERDAREEFEVAYSRRHRSIHEGERARARAFGLFTRVHLLAYGIDTAHRPLVDECLAGVSRLARAVGR